MSLANSDLARKGMLFRLSMASVPNAGRHPGTPRYIRSRQNAVSTTRKLSTNLTLQCWQLTIAVGDLNSARVTFEEFCNIQC